MAEKFNRKPMHVRTSRPENLRAKYSALEAYINTVVTFRFTTLGFYLAAVGIILAGTPTLEKYFFLALITISLYIIELRNRFLKNDLGALGMQIEKKWGYVINRKEDYDLDLTTIFGFVINKKDDPKPNPECGKFIGWKISHSLALDILYVVILFYALTRAIILLIPILAPIILHRVT